MPRQDDVTLVASALSVLGGAVVLLDEDLRVVVASAEASALAGTDLSPGARLASLLCGSGPERPVAEALASGRPVSAEVRRPGPAGKERVIIVRAEPLTRGDTVQGYVVLLSSSWALGETDTGVVTLHGLITRDDVMKRTLREVSRVARSEVSVLVRGETGSGKELVARAIHLESRRATGPFRAINCAALPAPLLESELFGHVRGAFTGAVRDAEGHVRLAHGGTLFLDEVAELPLELQAKLLRVLQERVVLPVGARQPVDVDVRFVAATHRSLREEVAAGRFRADLMYRLRVVPLFIPPLRERPLDVELLTDHFMAQMQIDAERKLERIAPRARAALASYDWPGNVRELQNALSYAFVMGEGPVLLESDLPPEIRGEEARPINEPARLGQGTLDVESRQLLRALERANGNKARAAKSLGISRVTLWRRLKALGLTDEAS